MAEEEIVIRIVADDSELVASLSGISDQAGELNGTMEGVSEGLEDAFEPSDVESYGDAVEGTSKKVKNTGKQVKKTGRSMGKFNRTAGRGISQLSRLSGVGGAATRSLGGLGFALAGTPFGAFAIAASVATVAYSFFSEKLGLNSAAIIKKNKELKESIQNLQAATTEQEFKIALQAVDINGLEGAEALQEKIKVAAEQEAIARRDIVELVEAEYLAQSILTESEINRGKNDIKTKALREEFLKQSLKRKAQGIAINNILIKRQGLQKELIDFNKKAAEDRKKAIIDTQNLSDSLIRDELQKRIIALEKVAKKREEQYIKTKQGAAQTATFIKQSEKVLAEDIEKIKGQFRSAELKARRALLSQFIKDEEEFQKDKAKTEFENRQKEIETIGKTGEERANLRKQNEEKLKADLLAINKKFTQQENTETLNAANDALDTEQVTAEARLNTKQEAARQVFAQVKHSEEEITAFKKDQDDERVAAEIAFQIKRLEVIRDANKLITKEGAAAIDAQILELQTRAKGVGVGIKKTVADETGDDPQGLGDLLGISKDTQSDISAVQDALEQVTSEVQKAVAERVAALQKELDFRNQRVGELQADLGNEIELNKLGKASNIKAAQDELNEQKRLRDTAAAEKKKAAEAQFAIDTALQASNLVTAIAGLYASLAGLPLGIGVPLATALSAVMLGAFIASKASAASATGFAEGGYTGDGGKYQQAGTVHRGEYVIDKETTAALGLQRVPMSNFGDVIGEHFSDMPNGQTVGKKNGKITNRLNTQIRQHKQNLLLSYEKGIKNALNGQNSILKGILAATENAPIVFPLGSDKYLIERGKHQKEIKKIKK
jgi:hypothetical protein